MQYVRPPLPEGPKKLDDPQNLKPHGFAPCYDIAGNLLFQHGMDGGDRWMLNDAAGKPVFAWNSRGFFTWVEYDALHRPTGSFVTATGDTTLTGGPRNPALPPDPPRPFEKILYGEDQADDRKHNLRGKPYKHCDAAGAVTIGDYDFKGNPLSSQREMTVDYKAIPDWSQAVALERDRFVTRTDFDALGRPLSVTTPDRSTYRPHYNEANLLDNVEVNLRGEKQGDALKWTPFVTNIDYNAKGQRERIEYANGATTTYEYDPLTFRLIHLKTTRPDDPDATASALFTRRDTVQDLRYTYDPSGNITRIVDAAHKTVFCDNQQIDAASDYAYDALYRLIAASGRERGRGAVYVGRHGQPDRHAARRQRRARLLRGDLRVRRGRQHNADGAPRRGERGRARRGDVEPALPIRRREQPAAGNQPARRRRWRVRRGRTGTTPTGT